MSELLGMLAPWLIGVGAIVWGMLNSAKADRERIKAKIAESSVKAQKRVIKQKDKQIEAIKFGEVIMDKELKGAHNEDSDSNLTRTDY